MTKWLLKIQVCCCCCCCCCSCSCTCCLCRCSSSSACDAECVLERYENEKKNEKEEGDIIICSSCYHTQKPNVMKDFVFIKKTNEQQQEEGPGSWSKEELKKLVEAVKMFGMLLLLLLLLLLLFFFFLFLYFKV